SADHERLPVQHIKLDREVTHAWGSPLHLIHETTPLRRGGRHRRTGRLGSKRDPPISALDARHEEAHEGAEERVAWANGGRAVRARPPTLDATQHRGAHGVRT